MNRWDCDTAGCPRSVVGCGGAIGLRAIGWFVRFDARALTGPEIFCPAHRPDPIVCLENHDLAECAPCKAEREAKTIQDGMYTRDDEKALGRIPV